MSNKKEPSQIAYNAYILTGGKSRRFLSDKSVSKLNNRTLTEILYEKLSSLAKETFIVGKKSSVHPFPFVEDKFPVQCALNGIMTALNHSDTEWSFIVSCDIPLIEKQTIQLISDNIQPDLDTVIPLVRNTPQPICSFYRFSSLSSFNKSFHQKDYRLRNIINNLKTQYVPIPQRHEIEFLNINTPADLQTAKDSIKLYI